MLRKRSDHSPRWLVVTTVLLWTFILLSWLVVATPPRTGTSDGWIDNGSVWDHTPDAPVSGTRCPN